MLENAGPHTKAVTRKAPPKNDVAAQCLVADFLLSGPLFEEADTTRLHSRESRVSRWPQRTSWAWQRPHLAGCHVPEGDL